VVSVPPARKPPPGAESEKEPDIPIMEDRVRTSKFKKMEVSVQGFYIMLGGALSVLPPQVAGEQFKRIGKSFAIHSEDIAEAWIDLAEDDARVRRIIESVTGFSTWGKVVGRHLEAIGDETPAIQGFRQQRVPQQPQQEGPSDLDAAMALAEFMAQAAAQQRQAQEGGNGAPQSGPSEEQVRRAMQEQQRQQQRPTRQQQQQPIPVTQQEAPQVSQRRPVGMPSPADLGVVNPDQSEYGDMPVPGEADVKG
jgi:hypothetical protein